MRGSKLCRQGNGVLALIAALAMATEGCGPSGPFPMVQVTGTATYDDGSPIPGDRVTVTFVPQTKPVDAKTHPRSGFAVLDETTGAFDVCTTSRYGDGLIRGKHKVFIVSVDENESQLPVVPRSYTDPRNTPLEIDTADSPLKIEIPRP